MPFDFASLVLVHHLAKRRQAQAQASPRQAALSALYASPVHATLSAPLSHPTAQALPHLALTLRPITAVKATTAGVRHPTPAEQAAQAVGLLKSQVQQVASSLAAKQAAYVAAHPKPAANAQPADIATWLKAGGLSPRAMFPEWQWHVLQKTPVPLGPLSAVSPLGPLEVGEAFATVQLGPNDVVLWYEHPSGAWAYYHHWGQDLGSILTSVANTVESVASQAAGVMGQVLQDVQTAASLIPGVGQVVNEVVTAAETALDALGGMKALAIALDTAYHAALAAVPGAEALAPMLDPIMGILKGIANGQSITKAALGQALQSVPTSPNFGSINPRSVASSLASWLASKVGIS